MGHLGDDEHRHVEGPRVLLEELEAGEVVAVITVDLGVQGPCVDDQCDPTTSRAGPSCRTAAAPTRSGKGTAT